MVVEFSDLPQLVRRILCGRIDDLHGTGKSIKPAGASKITSKQRTGAPLVMDFRQLVKSLEKQKANEPVHFIYTCGLPGAITLGVARLGMNVGICVSIGVLHYPGNVGRSEIQFEKVTFITFRRHKIVRKIHSLDRSALENYFPGSFIVRIVIPTQGIVGLSSLTTSASSSAATSALS